MSWKDSNKTKSGIIYASSGASINLTPINFPEKYYGSENMNSLIPKMSKPLAKDIRTGEGVLEWLVAAAISLLTIVSNASGSIHGLTWTQGGTYLTIVAGVKGLRRTLLKIFAIQKNVGVDAPIPFNPQNELAKLTNVSVDQQKQIIQKLDTLAANPQTAEVLKQAVQVSEKSKFGEMISKAESVGQDFEYAFGMTTREPSANGDLPEPEDAIPTLPDDSPTPEPVADDPNDPAPSTAPSTPPEAVSIPSAATEVPLPPNQG